MVLNDPVELFLFVFHKIDSNNVLSLSAKCDIFVILAESDTADRLIEFQESREIRTGCLYISRCDFAKQIKDKLTFWMRQCIRNLEINEILNEYSNRPLCWLKVIKMFMTTYNHRQYILQVKLHTVVTF